jgi:hypothetical protein
MLSFRSRQRAKATFRVPINITVADFLIVLRIEWVTRHAATDILLVSRVVWVSSHAASNGKIILRRLGAVVQFFGRYIQEVGPDNHGQLVLDLFR